MGKRIFYSFRLQPYSSMTDFFLFNVSTPHLTDGPFKCQIHHSTRRRPAGFTLRPLIVTEGSAESITSATLNIKVTEATKSSFIFYNITSPPAHGFIGSGNKPSINSVIPYSRSVVTHFTSDDVENGRLFYEHDGSETPNDRIQFVAYSWPLNFLFENELEISIRGVNNHPPRPVSRASFSVQVVLAGSRRITREMMAYVDDDWDSDPNGLKYSIEVRGRSLSGALEIGNVYDRTVSLSRPIFSWTQAEIDEGKLIFTHEGRESEGSVPFWVSDSKYRVNGKLYLSFPAAEPECIIFHVYSLD